MSRPQEATAATRPRTVMLLLFMLLAWHDIANGSTPRNRGRAALQLLDDDGTGPGAGATTPPFVPTAQLPDVLTFINGTRVTSASLWAARREELKALLDEHILGTRPAVRPKLQSHETTSKTGGGSGVVVARVLPSSHGSDLGIAAGDFLVSIGGGPLKVTITRRTLLQ